MFSKLSGRGAGGVTCFVPINDIVTTRLLSLPTGLLGTIVITMLYVQLFKADDDLNSCK